MRTLLVASTLAALVATTRTAHADGFYASESFGPAWSVGDELGGTYEGGDLSVRLALGRRSGRWAIEAFVGGSDLRERGEDSWSADSHGAVSYGVNLRRYVSLGRHWDLYGRAGLSKMSVSDSDPGYDYQPAPVERPSGSPPPPLELGGYAGRGFDYGAGVQLKGRVPALALLCPYLLLIPRLPGPRVGASLWLDVGQQVYRLRSDTGPTLDARFSGWTIGFSIGGVM